jgi:ribulose-phosphate 3-epimerase
MPEVLGKFARARELARPGTRFGIDGGIDLETGREAVRAGADYLVAGTFLFGAKDMASSIAGLRALGEEG